MASDIALITGALNAATREVTLSQAIDFKKLVTLVNYRTGEEIFTGNNPTNFGSIDITNMIVTVMFDTAGMLDTDPIQVIYGSPAFNTLATAAKQDTQITLETSIDGRLSDISKIVDNDRAKSSPIVGEDGVEAGKGVATTKTQRVAIVSDQDPISVTMASAPAGAATEATSQDILTELQIQTGSQATEATLDDARNNLVSILNALVNPLPLQTGAATEAKQDDEISKLNDIAGFLINVSTAAKQDAEAVLVGAVNETAPGTDTASSGLNGRLQRIAQRLTTLITNLGTWVFGPGTAAAAGRVTLASDDPAVASLSVLDDWDESDRAKVNSIAGQAGVDGGAGAVSAKTQRVVIATDQSAVPTSQSGTWTVQPGNTANTTAWKVDGSSVTQPISGTITATPPKASSANTPSILTSGGDVIASNTSRKSWGIQNLSGTNPLFVRMATGASSTVFHFCLGPGQANDDGFGASVSDDTYTGVVSATGTSPRFVVYEL